MSHWLQVVVAAPAHSSIAGPLTYQSESPLAPGVLVRVPLGKREVLGVVWEVLPDSGALLEMQTRHVAGVLEGLPPLSATWRKLVQFTAGITSDLWARWRWRRCHRNCATSAACSWRGV
jgi:primosomal protein N' (replication factor Y)